MLNYLAQKVKLPEIEDRLRYPRGDLLILVPPFARLTYPPLASHVLQAFAAQSGYKVSVFYTNLHLAALIGTRKYAVLSQTLPIFLAASRLFAPKAFDIPIDDALLDLVEIVNNLNDKQGAIWRQILRLPIETTLAELDLATMYSLSAEIDQWVDDIAATVASLNFDVIGCTSTFEQTNASVALLRHIKQLAPQKTTIIGGSNCEGEMAQGVADLSPDIDYVFRGEAETALVDFLGALSYGQRPQDRIISGKARVDLDEVPRPIYDEYFDQFDLFLPKLKHLKSSIQLSYETSRGCWWGQKTVCTFCGLNGEQLAFRQKQPQRVVADLNEMLGRYPTNKLYMVDTIMPYGYFKTLLPRLESELCGQAEIFYEQKSNLTLQQVMTLRRAGVSAIQPGIEALSTSLLKRMRKGVSARQNIALLRYGRAAGLDLIWNLLVGFPGDVLAEYEETLALLPLIHHLQPPFLDVLWPVTIQRFSPYFEQPESFGMKNMRPFGGYEAVLPAGFDPAKVAYFFTAGYASVAYNNPEVLLDLQRELTCWTEAWSNEGQEPPVLEMVAQSDQRFLLRDTRHLPGTESELLLDREQAVQALTAVPLTKAGDVDWAINNRIGIILDGWYVPLATAEPNLLAELESEVKRERIFLNVQRNPREAMTSKELA